MTAVATPAARLTRMFAAYTPEIRAQADAALTKLRKLLPGAVELVYDNYNAVVIAFGAGEKMSEIVLSIALYPRWVTLFFMRGSQLPDPDRRLGGSGKHIRQVRLDSAATLGEPAIRALIGHAAARATPPIDPKARRRLVIKAVAALQRSRRPSTIAAPRSSARRKSAKSSSRR